MGQIYRASLDCQKNLEQCNNAWKPDPWAEYQLIEFNVWSTTSGALASGINSLDERFQLSRQHASIIHNLLLLLNTYIVECKSTAGGNNKFRDASFQQPKEQALETLEARKKRVGKTLSQIVAITMHTNASIVHSSLWFTSDRHPWNDDTAGDYEKNLMGWFFDPQNLDFGSESQRRKDLTLTQNTLIQANLKRRHRFLAAKASAKSTASQPAETRSLRSKVQYPSPPILKADQNLFTCPYCYQELPVYFAQSSAWLEHIAADLRPFMCVVEQCCVKTSSVELYPSRALWEMHMLRKHGIEVFTCQICDQRCGTESEFGDHFRDRHGDECMKLSKDCDVSEIEVVEYAARAARKVVLKDNIQCPFCWNGICESERKLEHLAHCLQDFAMEAFIGATALKSRESWKPGVAAREQASTLDTLPVIPKISVKDISSSSIHPSAHGPGTPALSHLQIPPRKHRSHSDPSQEVTQKMKQALRLPNFNSTSSPRSIRTQRSFSDAQDTDNEEERNYSYEQYSSWVLRRQREITHGSASHTGSRIGGGLQASSLPGHPFAASSPVSPVSSTIAWGR